MPQICFTRVIHVAENPSSHFTPLPTSHHIAKVFSRSLRSFHSVHHHLGTFTAAQHILSLPLLLSHTRTHSIDRSNYSRGWNSKATAEIYYTCQSIKPNSIEILQNNQQSSQSNDGRRRNSVRTARLAEHLANVDLYVLCWCQAALLPYSVHIIFQRVRSKQWQSAPKIPPRSRQKSIFSRLKRANWFSFLLR